MGKRAVMRFAVFVWLVVQVVGVGQVTEVEDVAQMVKQAAELIVEKSNDFRLEQGLGKVRSDGLLTGGAADLAGFMARTNKYGHTVDGRRPAERAEQHGYAYCAVTENIAWQSNSTGFTAAGLTEKFVEGWKASPEHRKNLLTTDVTDIGVAVAHSKESGRNYAVQMFGRPKSKSIEFRITNESDTTIEYEIAEQRFSLPARYSMTHQQCDSSEVRFTLPTGEGKRTKVVGIKPSSDDRLVVVENQGQFRVTKK